MFIKKISVISLSSALALSVLLPATTSFAASTVTTVMQEAGEAATGENVVDVEHEKLIERVRTIFPEKFKFVSDQDFRVNFQPYQPWEGTSSYSLSFFKEVGNGKHINGHFEFAGKNLDLVSYYYSPQDVSDALYPAKVSKEAAQTIASKFLSNISQNANYRFSAENSLMYNHGFNRPITEPVEYYFNFERLENGIPVQDQNVNITVLGNGEVTQFYRGRFVDNASYENAQQVIPKKDALTKFNELMSIDLEYLVNRDYQGKHTVELIYNLNPMIAGMNPKTGQVKIGDHFITSLPEKKDIRMLADGTSKKSANPLTKEQAKAIAEKLLAPKEDHVKLMIEGVQEVERNGTTLYSIQYMYQTGSSGSGSSFEMNKQTGEIVSFHNFSVNNFDMPESTSSKQKISKEEALQKAVDYIKQYAYQNIDQYAYPIEAQASFYDNYSNSYSFHFPRVKNGIIVTGNGIHISVSKETGELISLSTTFDQISEWPAIEEAISIEEALEPFKQNLDLKLIYTNNNERNNYQLIYATDMKEKETFFNAINGIWEKHLYTQDQSKQARNKISHPWAADEINFLIDANIIQVKDPAVFNPNETVSRGEALGIMYKSLGRFYNGSWGLEPSASTNTFENIKADHPLYEIVERAATEKVIDTSTKTFELDQKLTREELAVWYARILRLQKVAEQEELYKLNFTDVSQMNGQYTGHIALIDALDILRKDQTNEFKPKGEVTIAELAVSTIRLAKLASEMNIEFR